MGADCRSAASNAISQFLDEPSDEDDGFTRAEAPDDCFRGLEVADVQRPDKAPPFTEWLRAEELMCAAPEFKRFAVAKKRGLQKDRNVPRVYFYTTSDLRYAYDELRGKNKAAETKFSVALLYGSSPDEPATLTVTARGCARLILRKVPADHAMCQAVFSAATEELKLDPAKQLVYKLSLIHISEPTRPY